jgi:two-component system sensor histidine kinase KdpD
VSAERESDVVQLTVRDVGIGIAPEEAEQVFDKFYRSPRVRSIPGTGLGLAICRGILTAHGGTIRAEPAAGGGTRMVVRLPWRAPEDVRTGDDGEEARGPGGGCTGTGD